MRLWKWLLLGVILQACMVNDSKSIQSDISEPGTGNEPALRKTAAGDTVRMPQVADDKIAGRVPLPLSIYKDTGTGTEYQINPGWRVVPRQAAQGAYGRPLAKTADGLIRTWTDQTGQVETRVYECVSSAKAQHQSVGCQVEPGFVLTGGGAYADYGTGPGALLWESRPIDENLITWVASSKDHTSPNPHWLHVYAIGMRLKDNNGNYISTSTLVKTVFRLTTATTSPAVHWPSQEQGAVSAVFMGYGARTNWSGSGSLLTSLWASGDSQRRESSAWAKGKDHKTSDPSTLTTYLISAKLNEKCCVFGVDIQNFGLLIFQSPTGNGSAVGTGVAVAFVDATPGWVMISIGGSAEWTSGPGRLLFGIKPTGTYQGQVGVYSKDHRDVSAGYNTATLIEARKF